MEAGRKDCEEETLQTAFKKLRVDAESVTGAVSVADVLVPRATPRPGPDSGGAKPKLSCPKDNWHGCMRKSSRGASRSQRRRRSKSPILHPPKFSYCSTAASALSTSGLKRLAVPEAAEPRPLVDGGPASSSVALPAQKELSPSAIFGACAGYESRVGAVGSSKSLEIPGVVGRDRVVLSGEEGVPEKSACDFGALSKLHSSSDVPLASCSCAQKNSCDAPEESGRGAEGGPCPCQTHHQSWSGVEVYSFTGLRNAISECGRSLPGHGHAPRTLSTSSNAAAAAVSSSSSPSGSPRSCSEQARAYVDDITIEDLSGYMEYYLYIPKKMSHMAEMMYT